MLDERRNSNRIDLRVPVQYRTKSKEQTIGCLSHDLSTEGVGINVEDFMPLNSEVSLQIGLQPNKVVEINGKISWIQTIPYADRYRIGVRFEDDDVSYFAKQEIKKFLEQSKAKLNP